MNADIRNFIAELTATRSAQLYRMAHAPNGASEGDIKNLASLQMALTAAREVLEAHQPRLGYGSESAIESSVQRQVWPEFRDRALASHG